MAVVTPSSLPMASAWGAPAADRPATEAAMAAVAISFFMFVPFRRMAPFRSRILINSAVDGAVARFAPIGPQGSSGPELRAPPLK
ncbi:hypothetical protein GCM10018775_16070 [Streptomyces umbrinus]|nr:hypothetical protein GCM10018775_16070 [Streptomyces umbrinus]